MSENEDEEIGYKKPPKASQWKPGQSGNPKGRPKVEKDFEKLFDHELSVPVRITDGGGARTTTKRELFVKTLINSALKGDRSAQKLVFVYMKSHVAIDGFEPDPGDREALRALVEQAQLKDDEREEPRNG